jgi:hypothetical protein
VKGTLKEFMNPKVFGLSSCHWHNWVLIDTRVTIREKDRDLSSPTYELFNSNRGEHSPLVREDRRQELLTRVMLGWQLRKMFPKTQIHAKPPLGPFLRPRPKTEVKNLSSSWIFGKAEQWDLETYVVSNLISIPLALSRITPASARQFSQTDSPNLAPDYQIDLRGGTADDTHNVRMI